VFSKKVHTTEIDLGLLKGRLEVLSPALGNVMEISETALADAGNK